MILPWQSNDVVFFGIDSDLEVAGQHPSLASPHLNMRIQTHWGKDSTPLEDEDEDIIRNPHLFALAIVLLEVAYETPLEELHKEFESGPPTPGRRNILDWRIS
jgi:hypothetical protein